MGEKIISEFTKVLVAQYLDNNGYRDSLAAFLKESHLSRKALLQDHGETLEIILHERIKFAEREIGCKLALLTLNGSVDEVEFPLPSWDPSLQFEELRAHDDITDLVVEAHIGPERLLLSMSNRKAKVYSSYNLETCGLLEGSKTSGLLKPCGLFGQTGYYYGCGLDGKLYIYNNEDSKPYMSHRMHRRIITHAEACTLDGGSWFFISCGLDNYLKIHRIQLDGGIVELWAETKIPSTCSALQTAIDQDDILIYLARTEITHLICFEVITSRPALNQKYRLPLNNTQFTPHAFQIRDMKYMPDENILLVATSHIPHMRLLVVNLPQREENEEVFYDRVIRDMVTEVPQDNYSQPSLAILPSKGGIIASGNDGIYAIDIAKADSWHLDCLPRGRVKCLAINDFSGLIVIGFVDKTARFVRPFEATDLFSLNNVNLDILTENFPLEFYFEYLILWPELFFKSVERTSISGYMMAKTEGKGSEWHSHITAVTVAPELRRVSLASRLCDSLEAITDSEPHEVNFIDLFVKCNNHLAIALYEKLGYSVYRRVIGYYNSSEDGYPENLKIADDDKDAFDMRKSMRRDKGHSVRPDGRRHRCYPHDTKF